MKDTLENKFPTDESGNLEDTKILDVTPEVTSENVVTSEEPEEIVEAVVEMEPAVVAESEVLEVVVEPVASEDVEAPVEEETTQNKVNKLSKEEILEKLAGLVVASAESARNEVDSLKQAYYKIRRNEVDELKRDFLADGGEEKDFNAQEDETEKKIKELLASYKEKRAAIIASEERLKIDNYAKKLALIERLKELIGSNEDFNKLYNEFKDIQQQWKDIKSVPAEHVNELWKTYQVYSEKFYDIIKINNQFRDYDFKKNLEMKAALCETVEKLEAEPDVVSAFHQLQKLHQQWREIGPVAKEIREDLWTRFKNASTVINKKHQDHFESLKGKEQDNLDAKITICEEIEQIDYTLLKTFKDWEDKNREVIDLQNKWKTIGFAPKKANVKVFERFRAACDIYFNNKSEFYKSIKEGMDTNLEQKRELCEKAEALKDSTDWKEATDKMIGLQKEWKTVGSVARKHSDLIWKRFITACDYFFEQKNKNVSSQKSVEQENLAAKKALIEKIVAITESGDAAVVVLKEYMAEWATLGHVPFKEKDKVYKEYHDSVDAQFDRLKVDRSDRKMQNFRSNLNGMSDGKSKGRVFGERERLMRQFDRMKVELQTYENNIGFFSVSSKGGGGLVKEMNRKIDSLKEEMALIVKKIDAIDETLE